MQAEIDLFQDQGIRVEIGRTGTGLRAAVEVNFLARESRLCLLHLVVNGLGLFALHEEMDRFYREGGATLLPTEVPQ